MPGQLIAPTDIIVLYEKPMLLTHYVCSTVVCISLKPMDDRLSQ